MNIELNLNDVEVFFLKRALEWRIQNIDYVIQKKQLEGLKKANYLSEKATLINLIDEMEKKEHETDSIRQEDGVGETVATAEPEDAE